MLAGIDFRERVLLSLQFLPEDPIKANVGLEHEIGSSAGEGRKQ
jgi:hypothetical protein